MSIDPYIVLGSAVVGFLVGMTGAGGGALMTPMLILFFNVKPSTAISSDLVAAVLMRPVGAAVHMTKKTVNYGLVGYMVLGSVPAALLGAWSLHLLGNSKGAESHVQTILGAALLVGAAAMTLRVLLDKDRVVVEGINRVWKHVKPSQRTPQGGRIQKDAPIHISNVMPIDPTTNKGTRVKFEVRDGIKHRVAVKSGADLGRTGKKADKK